MILFINACVRTGSRTKRLADRLISKLNGPVEELRLWQADFPTVDADFLHRRSALIEKGSYGDVMFDYARSFAAADEIVVAAPFWDLSFPAALKQYFEQITVSGLTFVYSEKGIPQGLCRAKRLFYVTTAGGTVFSEEYGYGYVKALAQGFYGIKDTVLFKAEGLDIVGADVEAILRGTETEIDGYFR